MADKDDVLNNLIQHIRAALTDHLTVINRNTYVALSHNVRTLFSMGVHRPGIEDIILSENGLDAFITGMDEALVTDLMTIQRRVWMTVAGGIQFKLDELFQRYVECIIGAAGSTYTDSDAGQIRAGLKGHPYLLALHWMELLTREDLEAIGIEPLRRSEREDSDE